MSLAGSMGQFAVADDGSCWFWTGERWLPWERPPLPEPAITGIRYDPPPGYRAPDSPNDQFYPADTTPVRRGPGRPRKVTP